MKTSNSETSYLRRQLGRAVSASALLLLGFAASGQVVPKSPVGTWNCVMSGAREGLAIITIFEDGNFTADEILVPKKPRISTAGSDPRGSTGRTPDVTSTNSVLPSVTDIYGAEHPNGRWGFDSRGRVMGYFYEITRPEYATNSDDVVTATAVTNAISFVGSVVPGRRLTLLASTPSGKVNLRGVPDMPVADASGSWSGEKRAGQLRYNEFFTLTRVSPDANVYMVQGDGPGYAYSGIAMTCPQKKLAMVLGIDPVFPVVTDPNAVPALVRASFGGVNFRRFNGTLHSVEGAGDADVQRFNFKVERQ